MTGSMSPVLYVVILAMVPAILAIEIDNGLIGQPEVECAVNSVEMQFRTEKPFKGKIFVKGHFDDPNCRVDYSNAFDTDRPTGGIVLQHGACDMDRQRMLQPQGLQFSAVVIISFHPVFITKLDRAFHIKCLYRETTATVTQNLEVSQLATTQLSETFPMPICTYTIRKDEIDGEILRYARVGEQVVHRWECQTDVYGILVHSCVVEDGQGDRTMLIDENGCHTDRFLIGDPTYVEALDMAYRESHVFKFADRVAVRFLCQIKLCMKENGGCNGITPPICSRPDEAVRSERLIQQSQDADTKDLLDVTENKNETSSTTTTSTSTTAKPMMAGLTKLRARRDVDEQTSTLLKQRSTNLPKTLNFIPVDGDFSSQYIYVLDTTEDPEAPTAKKVDREQYYNLLIRSHGAIVSEMPGTGPVCLSSVTFGVLLGAVCLILCIFISAAILLLCTKWRPALVNAAANNGKKTVSLTGSDWSCISSATSVTSAPSTAGACNTHPMWSS